MAQRIHFCGKLITVICWFCAGATFAAEFSTWTSVSGAQVEAKWVGVEEGNLVVLETENGDQLSIPLHALSEADQAKAMELAGAENGGEEEGDASDYVPKAKNPWLPVFESGPYTDSFAVYDSPYYLFVMNGEGQSYILPKDENKQVRDTGIFMRGLSVRFKKPDPKRKNRMLTQRRPVQEVFENPQPMMNPSSIELTGLFSNNVSFTKSYAFTPTSITVDYDITDPKDITYPTFQGASGFRLPPSADIADDVPQTEREKMLDGWSLTLYPMRRSASGSSKPTVLQYWEAVHKQEGNVERAVIKGPWGARQVTIEYRGAPGRAGLYIGRSLWEGYNMGFNWQWDRVKNVGMTVTFE
jgi:hypothetical protein